MGNETSFLDALLSWQTLIAAVVSAAITITGIYIKGQVERKSSSRKYILDNAYTIHERLHDNLRNFLRNDNREQFLDSIKVEW